MRCKCDKCDYAFVTVLTLKKHKVTCHNKTPSSRIRSAIYSFPLYSLSVSVTTLVDAELKGRREGTGRGSKVLKEVLKDLE